MAEKVAPARARGKMVAVNQAAKQAKDRSKPGPRVYEKFISQANNGYNVGGFGANDLIEATIAMRNVTPTSTPDKTPPPRRGKRRLLFPARIRRLAALQYPHENPLRSLRLLLSPLPHRLVSAGVVQW